jgi:hypothetical protein
MNGGLQHETTLAAGFLVLSDVAEVSAADRFDKSAVDKVFWN